MNIHHITTLFVLKSFILSGWLLKEKDKKSESASLLVKIGIGHENNDLYIATNNNNNNTFLNNKSA